jgi:transcriptional regulator with XRE-family HTH domain
MKTQVLGNYLRMHRKKSGFSQRELGSLLGYKDLSQVSRHERSLSLPPLDIALCYEVIFRVPASDLFFGVHAAVTRQIESKLVALEAELGQRSGKGRGATVTAKKLVWLAERKEG